MKNAFLLLACLLLAGSCIKKPEYRPQTALVTYTFEGGKDMDALFDFTATYTEAGNRTVSERIDKLPWTKQVTAIVPFDARLEVGFEARTEIPGQTAYDVGFRGSIDRAAQPVAATVSAGTRAGDNEVLRFSVELPDGIAPEQVTARIAPLKYDKHFAFSYTADDSRVGAYALVWRRIHRKWIDDKANFHCNTTPTTGSVPAYTLAMTDGCGNERRFGFGAAIGATNGNSYSPDGFITDANPNSNYLSWADLREMMALGGFAVYYHNVNQQIYDESSPASIREGYEVDRQKVLRELGVEMKTLALPDGKAAYIEAAESYDPITFIRTSINRPGEYTLPKIHLATAGSLYKQQTYDGILREVPTKLTELADQAASTDPYWVSLTSHTPSTELIDLLVTIHDTYGKGGADNLWVASYDEVYEYQEWRTTAAIRKQAEGRTVTFEVTLPAHPEFMFRELSLLVSGTGGDCGVQPLSDNIYGMSHAAHKGGMLLNVNFDPQLPARAEHFTARYEASGLDADKEDARYVVSQLLPALAAPFEARIARTAPPLVFTSVMLNDGAATTYSREVQITLDASEDVISWRAAEKQDLTGVPWKPYVASPVGYTLSSGFGKKTLYVQVATDRRESDIRSASIRYLDVPASGTIPHDAVEAYVEKYDGHKFTVSKKIKP